MHVGQTLAGILIIVLALRDAFVSILLPRTVSRANRISARLTSNLWRVYTRLYWPGSRKEDNGLSVFGPLSIVLLIAVWAILLIVGFAFLVVGLEIPLNGATPTMDQALYSSGVTFLTLGFGDVVLSGSLGHIMSVVEAGTGFGFLAIVVSYLPVLYQSFSRREVLITLMDARGGSPPSGGEMIRRFAENKDWEGLVRWLERWETWASELLETHLSYPTLAYYRSQHSDTSWLCAMTAVMDACSIIISAMPEEHSCDMARRQARLTFAMCRHAVVDLSQIFNTRPDLKFDRLSDETYDTIAESLREVGVLMGTDQSTKNTLGRTRSLYEPYVESLSARFRLKLPLWIKDPKEKDNWQTSSWDRHV